MEVPYRAQIEEIKGGEFVVRGIQRLMEELNAQPFRIGNNAIRQGILTPNTNMVGDIGDLYLRQDSADAAAAGQPGLYFKGRNNGQNTGWVAVPPFVVSEVNTGTINDYNINDASLIRWNNASLVTLNGLKAGYDGQQVTLVSIGAGQVDLAHQNTGSAAENRLVNFVTSGITSLAAGSGSATYMYDGTTLRWRLIAHDQGKWITRTFAAGNFTGNGSMTWTLQAGDVTTDHWFVKGKALFYAGTLLTTTVGGTLNTTLQVAIPNGWTTVTQTRSGAWAQDNGTATIAYAEVLGGAATVIGVHRGNEANWGASTDLTAVAFQLAFELT